jgi:selT/selW/selH-like putative selenoprotein
LETEFGNTVKLIEGKDGVFEVTRDGNLVFSKRSIGRFPDDGEVAGIIRDGS